MPWGIGLALGAAVGLGVAAPALSQAGADDGGQPPPGAPPVSQTSDFTPGGQPANPHPDRRGAPTTHRGPVERTAGTDGQGAAGDDRVDGGGNGADLPGGRSD